MNPLNDPLLLALLLAAVLLLGLSKGGFFGLGVMALPMLSLVMPPLQAAAILMPVTLAQDVLTVWTYRHNWSGWNLALMVPAMAVGMGLATLFAASLQPHHIRLIVGVIAALFVLRHWAGAAAARLSVRPNRVTAVLFGGLGGFTTLLANAGGPAWQIHLLPQGLDKATYVGTVTFLFAISNVFKVPAYGSLGLMTWDNLRIGLALLPLAIAANALGLWLVRRVSTEQFFRIAYILMFIVAVELIRGSVAVMLGW